MLRFVAVFGSEKDFCLLSHTCVDPLVFARPFCVPNRMLRYVDLLFQAVESDCQKVWSLFHTGCVLRCVPLIVGQ